MTLLVLIVATALSISFICSVLEAALFSARVPELLARRERGDGAAALLLELKTERMDDAISAILILNTIAHTIGAALAGAQAAVVFGDRWVGVFSGVLTLLVLVATEIVPKTLGATYASPLVGFVARSVHALTVVLSPLLKLSRAAFRGPKWAPSWPWRPARGPCSARSRASSPMSFAWRASSWPT